jgi:hypothetical protein
MLVLSRICLRPPATRSALEEMAVVEQAVQHGSDGGAVAEQFSPVLDRAVGSEQCASETIALMRLSRAAAKSSERPPQLSPITAISDVSAFGIVRENPIKKEISEA